MTACTATPRSVSCATPDEEEPLEVSVRNATVNYIKLDGTEMSAAWSAGRGWR